MRIGRGRVKKLSIIVAMAAACVSHAALAHICPINECDYGNPQYQAAYEKYKAADAVYRSCTGPSVKSFLSAVDSLAILYPRFGIAYRAFNDETKAAEDAWAADNAAQAAANDAAQAAAQTALNTAQAALKAAQAADPAALDAARRTYVAALNAASAANYPDNDAAEDASFAAQQARINKARQRFEDRILRTAEPDALELYNLYQLKVRQQVQQCGSAPTLPEAPRK